MKGRFLYVVGSYPTLTETFIQREIVGLRALGLDIEVCSLDALDRLRECSHAITRPLRTLHTAKHMRRALDSLCSRRFAGTLLHTTYLASRATDVSHIHAHFLGAPAIIAYSLSSELRIPFSLTAHAHDIYVESTPGIVISSACFRTTCTETNRSHLNGQYPGSSFELVRHGIDPGPYTSEGEPRQGGPCRLLAIGRSVEKKGFLYLVRACRELRDSRFPYVCTIVGEGPGHEAIQSEIARHDLEGCVLLEDFLPHDQLIKRYHEADILVVPSVVAQDGDRDGVPNVILEAMASRLPVIATDAGSIPEVVRDNATGLLVPQREPQSLAQGIRTLWNDVLLRTRLAEAAFSLVQAEFRPEKWLSKLQAMLAQP